jgi:hypothetical protein
VKGDKGGDEMNDKSTDACHKPGDEVPESGIYINPQTREKAACNKGDPFPPTSEDNQCWQIDTPTKENN